MHRTISCLALSLAGCGGGGGGGDAGGLPAGPSGIWRDNTSAALIIPGGVARFVMTTGPGGNTIGQYVCDLVTDAGGMLLSPDSQCGIFVHQASAVGGLIGQREASGSISREGPLEISLTDGGGGNPEVLNLPYSAASTQPPASLASVAGSWSYTDVGGYSVNVSVTAGGNLTATDSQGCNFAGTVSAAARSTNLYEFALEVTGCTAVTTSYRGLGAQLDGGLLVGLSGAQLFVNTSYVWQLTQP